MMLNISSVSIFFWTIVFDRVHVKAEILELLPQLNSSHLVLDESTLPSGNDESTPLYMTFAAGAITSSQRKDQIPFSRVHCNPRTKWLHGVCG